eukprot:gnl/MRDRNA2_/MRDRNA2_222687_c0_seq1.p1 gnl/MRDRNA2_/MRDRNA2_222687_c0~~gnl/MRDRNA2_/MRDRNA2_222687_c0_seq1.p1  ORF type:complete len:206 (-),score=31.00 gnl/MRDRNA2_/MRDRNA2_222687_c0_seq1:43-660(-)
MVLLSVTRRGSYSSRHCCYMSFLARGCRMIMLLGFVAEAQVDANIPVIAQEAMDHFLDRAVKGLTYADMDDTIIAKAPSLNPQRCWYTVQHSSILAPRCNAHHSSIAPRFLPICHDRGSRGHSFNHREHSRHEGRRRRAVKWYVDWKNLAEQKQSENMREEAELAMKKANAEEEEAARSQAAAVAAAAKIQAARAQSSSTTPNPG